MRPPLGRVLVVVVVVEEVVVLVAVEVEGHRITMEWASEADKQAEDQRIFMLRYYIAI